jgi:hypothetical protein
MLAVSASSEPTHAVRHLQTKQTRLQKIAELAATQQHSRRQPISQSSARRASNFPSNRCNPARRQAVAIVANRLAYCPAQLNAESDVPLFERVASAVDPATLPRRTCEQIVAELRDAASFFASSRETSSVFVFRSRARS